MARKQALWQIKGNYSRYCLVEYIYGMSLRVRFFKKIKDCIFKSERNLKGILRFFSKQINPRFLGSCCVKGTEESTSRVDYLVHDPTNLGSIQSGSGFFGSFDAP